MEEITIQRRYRFSAGHRYYRPEWSEEENQRRFGKCTNSPGHGHNYRLLVGVSGEPDPETGFVVDLDRLDEIVRTAVIDILDHRHINQAVESFAPGRAIPSSENLVLWIRDQLRPKLTGPIRLSALELLEDEDLGASWREPSATFA